MNPKKSLGQHFLTDENIAGKIVSSLGESDDYNNILEIGPGMGMLTKYLYKREKQQIYIIEKDRQAHEHLLKTFPENKDRIILADFLDFDLNDLFQFKFAVIGNFPYNISSQILFRILEFRNRIPIVVGMFQKEVAERIAAPPDNKTYGILSVLAQAYYDIEYLFTVNETVFFPKPKVKSAVIRLKRNKNTFLDCNEDLFFDIVKATFNYRRKMLRNTLKPFRKPGDNIDEAILSKRPENLSVSDFISLTKKLSP
jgi:16S rRNA (adenine1518-N6/adenine1519-N6)-dimethyltransferase